MITTPINSVLDRMVTLSRAMDQALGPLPDTLSNLPAQAAWMPALDAWETENGYLVELDLPGVKPEDVEIEFEKNTLTIRGTRSAKHDAGNGKRVFFAERDWGAFWRSLRFPQHVEGDSISASFENGVLTVTVPKAESAKPRRIAVTAPAQISG